MGDWRKFRANLTKRERGIPIGIFRKILSELDFKVIKETFCGFLAIPKLFGRFFSGGIYNNNLMTRLDEVACRALTWNISYHPTTVLEKFMPTSVYYVLYKTAIPGYSNRSEDHQPEKTSNYSKGHVGLF